MAATLNYNKLALAWQPGVANTRRFNVILSIVMLLMILFMLVLTYIKVPPQEKRQQVVVPDRIADFIAKKEKPVVKPPPPEVKPKPPQKPIPEPEPVKEPEVVPERIRPSEREQKPLTESQKKAREVAKSSGLLALSNELNDLIDKDAQATVGRRITTNTTNTADAATAAAGYNDDALTAGIVQTGGTVSADVIAAVNTTELEDRKVNADLAERTAKEESAIAEVKAKPKRSADESVTLVFEKNKGTLYSLYERARRTTQDLQGKLVLQITISPTGDVIDVKIVSSELNNPELEAKIVSRVKTFKFESNGEKPVTVTYPIEFLPS
jgi:periplasmic protein TonB